VVRDHVAGSAAELRVAHPAYTAVVRSRVSEATVRLVRSQLTADADEASPRPEQVLRRCVAALDYDLPVRDAGLLTRAGRQAMTVPDPALAQRLARAAVEAGGGFEAHLLLVEATRWAGEPEHSERLAAEAARLPAADVDTARLAAVRALNLTCALGRAPDAVAVLREADVNVRSGEGRAIVSAARCMLAVLGGDRDAERKATEVLAAAPPGSPARPLAAAAAALSLALAGQTERALATVQDGWAAVDATWSVSEPLLTCVVLAHAEVLALYMAGRLRELDRRTTAWLRRNLKAPEWAGDAIAALHRGWAALSRGRSGQAVRWLEESLSGLQRQDPAGMHGLCSALLATTCALRGDVVRAREVLEEQTRNPHGILPIFEPMSGLARASLAGAEGRAADAGRLLLEAAAQAAEQGQAGAQALLLHRAVHFGWAAEIAEPLRDLAARLDSPFLGDLAAHAQAVVARDGGRLEEASRRLEEAGALMFAADSAAAAATAHERTGARRPAAEWTTRSKALAEECGLREPAALEGLPSTALTAREGEVAHLAGRGLSNQAIAERLFLSVRTVEAHLSHIYTKLGITGRAGLAVFLAESRPASSPDRSAIAAGD
jgi:DNA-binding CsgD family transcriptional regulator